MLAHEEERTEDSFSDRGRFLLLSSLSNDEGHNLATGVTGEREWDHALVSALRAISSMLGSIGHTPGGT